MTIVIGITGGIGAGKSTLLKHLKQKKLFIHDSDVAVNKIYLKPTNKLIKTLKEIGLNEALNKNKINKKIISKIIFSDNKIRKSLEKFIHKEIKKIRKNFINLHKKKKTKSVFIDVPLLFEKKIDKEFDFIICVLSSKIKRLKRVVSKRKINKETFYKIIKNQTNDKERKKRANLCIYNNKTKKHFIKKIDNVLLKKIES